MSSTVARRSTLPPDTLLVAGLAVDAREGAVAEAARWLHDRDIVQLTFAGEVSVPALQRLLAVLSEDTRVVRERGGPATVWADDGDPAIGVQQIDYTHVLADRDVTGPIRRKDDVWRSLVRGILNRARPTDEAVHTRLLSIAGDVTAIGELTTDVIAPHHTLDGSPRLALRIPANLTCALTLYSLDGRQVASVQVAGGAGGEQLLALPGTGHVAAGIYWVRAAAGGRTLTQRVIVMR